MLRDNCATHKVSVSMYLVSLAAHARGVFAAVHQSCAAECMVTKALRENIRRRKRNSAVLHGALPVLPAPSPKVSVSTTQFEARQAFGKHLPRFDYRTNPRMHTLPFNGQVATHAYIAVQWTGCNSCIHCRSMDRLQHAETCSYVAAFGTWFELCHGLWLHHSSGPALRRWQRYLGLLQEWTVGNHQPTCVPGDAIRSSMGSLGAHTHTR